MATEKIIIVDTDGDGSEHYSSLHAALIGESGGSPQVLTSADLVTNNEKAIFRCRASDNTSAGTHPADTTKVRGTDFSLYTFNRPNDNIIVIEADEDHRHSGKWDDTKYRMVTTDEQAIMSNGDELDVDGLQFERVYVSSQFSEAVNFGSFDGDVTYNISNCIAKIENGANSCFYLNATTGTYNYYNCIAYGAGRWNFRTGNNEGITQNYYNCISALNSYAVTTEFQYADTCVNCISVGHAGTDLPSCADHCASDDGIGTNAQTLNSTNNYENEFVDYANKDFRPVIGAKSVNNGTNDPASGLFSTDILGIARLFSWDIGPFEYVTGGTTYQVTAADGIDVGETVTRVATLRATASDGISAGDNNTKLAQLLAAAGDGANFGESLSRILKVLASASDGASIGDSGARTARLPGGAADGLTGTDGAASRADLVAAASDGLSGGDTPAAIALLLASAVDGARIGDTAVGDLPGLTAEAIDGLRVGDQAGVVAAILAAATDAASMGDAPSTVAGFGAAASDGVTISDQTTAVLLILAAIADGITLSDAPEWLSAVSGVVSDGISFSDTGVARASFRVTVADTVSLIEALATVMRLGAQAVDGMTLGDVSVTVTNLASGAVTITFTSAAAQVTFTAAKPTITFQ